MASTRSKTIIILAVLLSLVVSGCGKSSYTQAERQSYLDGVDKILSGHAFMIKEGDYGSLLDPKKQAALKDIMSFKSFKTKYEGTALEKQYAFIPVLDKLSIKAESYTVLAALSGRSQTDELSGGKVNAAEQNDVKKAEVALVEYKALIEQAQLKRLQADKTSSPASSASPAPQ